MAELHIDLYRAATQYLANQNVPLPLTGSKQELQAELENFAANVSALDPRTLLPEGSQLATLPAVYVWKLFAFAVMRIESDNVTALRIADAAIRQAQGMPSSGPVAQPEVMF